MKTWNLLGTVTTSFAVLALTLTPAFAASSKTPSTGNKSNTVTTQMVTKGSTSTSGAGAQPLTTSTGDCGSATLTMFNGGSSSKIDANWQLKSTIGPIAWEDVTVTLSNGDWENYDGAGPVLSSAASGQFTFSGLSANTTYQGTLTGWIETDTGTKCTIIPTSTFATTA